jgi:hypothetical protein
MLRVTIYQFTYVLSLIGALFNNMAVIFEQVIDEKFVEINCWTMMIFIDLSSKSLAENQSIHEASRYWL